MRVQANATNSSRIFLSSSHFTKISLERALVDINNFITNNTGEIILVDIRNDNADYGRAGVDVDFTIVANLVNRIVNSAYILPKTKLTSAISTYGGVYFAGFDFNSSF